MVSKNEANFVEPQDKPSPPHMMPLPPSKESKNNGKDTKGEKDVKDNGLEEPVAVGDKPKDAVAETVESKA